MIVEHAALDALSPQGRAAAMEGADSYYGSLPWYANFAATCLDPGDRLRLYELPGDPGPGASGAAGRPIVLFMRARPERFGPLPARGLASLTNYYSCGHALTGLDGAADGAARIAGWARELRRGRDRPDRIAFDALDAPSPSFAALVGGLGAAGYLVETYPQFGNWFLRPAGCDFETYWESRDAQLRNTVERKERKLRREHRVTIDLLDDAAAAEAAVAGYEAVYAESWKTPEPYRDFIPGLIRTGLAASAVSVGLLGLDGCPAAAQLWVTHRGRATIFKLAHKEAAKRYSVGSILTRHILQGAIRRGGLEEIDFGRGDDPYKRLWLPERRQRWGVIAYEPATLAGLAYAARNLGPKAVRRVVSRLVGRRGGG